MVSNSLMNEMLVRSADIELVADATEQLLSTRHDALTGLLNDAEPEAVSNSTLDLLLAGATVAVGAASAGIGGAVAANIAGALVQGGGIGREFVKSAFKDVIDGSIGSAVNDEIVGAARKDGLGRAHKVFFGGQATGIRSMIPHAKGVARHKAREAAEAASDPGAALAAMHDGLVRSYGDAQAHQERQSSIEWLNVLARADLGVVEDAEHGTGADLEQMAPRNKGPAEMLFGRTERGVVRVDLWGRATDEPYWVRSARIAGTNPDMVAQLDRFGLTLDELGLNVWVSGRAYSHQPVQHSELEFGQSDAGVFHLGDHEGHGNAWLGFYSRGEHSNAMLRVFDEARWADAEGDAEAGAQQVLDELLAQTPGELGLKHG